MKATRREVLVGMSALGLIGPSVARAAVPTLRIATVAPPDTPWAEGLTSFKNKVEGIVPGKISIRPFLGGTLGDENETVSACLRGQIEGVAASTGALASVVPELAVLELPYLFRSAAEADHILDSVIRADLDAAFKARGLVLGFWSENGYRNFGTSFGFVKSPAALKGHKMRAQESPVHLAMYRAYGASPVPIPTTEVLTSLQTGVVDGWDNTILFAMAAQWLTATKYVTITNHIYQPAAIVFNKAWYDAQPSDVRAAITTSGTALIGSMRRMIRALQPELLANLPAMDVQTYTLTAAERATFDAPSKIARDTYMASASAGQKALFAKITAGLATYRASSH